MGARRTARAQPHRLSAGLGVGVGLPHEAIPQAGGGPMAPRVDGGVEELLQTHLVVRRLRNANRVTPQLLVHAFSMSRSTPTDAAIDLARLLRNAEPCVRPGTWPRHAWRPRTR